MKTNLQAILPLSTAPGASAPGATAPGSFSAQPTSFPTYTRSPWLLPLQPGLFRLGLLALLLSGAVFVGFDVWGNVRESGAAFAIFLFHYITAACYTFVLLGEGLLKFWKGQTVSGRSARWVALLLWLMSAFALNRSFAVFQQSTGWLTVALLITGAAMVGYGWRDALTVRWQQVLYAFLAAGFWLVLYAAIYVSPLYPWSIPGVIALGISVHTFVPALLAGALGKRLWFDYAANEHLRPGIIVGLAVPVIGVSLFLVSWSTRVGQIERAQAAHVTTKTTDLPAWVLVGQTLPADWITARLLQVGSTFDEGPFSGNNSFGNFGSQMALDDVKQHDPLVVIANTLFPVASLPETDQIKLLNVLYNKRHGTEEKLWSGRNLVTQSVISQARIWPQYRLAYTETTIRVRNTAQHTTREALYTFYLPNGATVSALSLWLNGREAPARLTTVGKADTAYRTIVGVESRDPAVAFWQEGGRVTVRVFPCIAGQDRQFKIGITQPLAFADGKLTLENIAFDGPGTESAEETVQLDFAQTPTGIESPWLFDKLAGNRLTHADSYDPDWQLRFDAPTLATEPFVLANKAYQIADYQPTTQAFNPEAVYLDVNATWNADEFTEIVHSAKPRPVWVWDDGLVQLTDQNQAALFDRLHQRQFTVFPIYRIKNPATALLITKGPATGPVLADLKDDVFAQNMTHAARQTGQLHTFSLDTQLSPMLRSLAELRVLAVMSGSVADLIQTVFGHQTFITTTESASSIAIPQAGVLIRETTISGEKTPGKTTPGNVVSKTTGTASLAPDHLARLFTYNALMQQVGRRYFDTSYRDDEDLQKQAQQAHILSPVSTLIVLETQADYDRFGIKRDPNGLDNATLKSDGAVPEPHEWAMLTLLAGAAGWLFWKKRKNPDYARA